jgi:hypothetical protein
VRIITGISNPSLLVISLNESAIYAVYPPIHRPIPYKIQCPIKSLNQQVRTSKNSHSGPIRHLSLLRRLTKRLPDRPRSSKTKPRAQKDNCKIEDTMCPHKAIITPNVRIEDVKTMPQIDPHLHSDRTHISHSRRYGHTRPPA